MSKLSERFKKVYEEVSTDNDELKNNLLEKVNSVPYWNEYTPEKQRDMVKSFVENSDIENKEPVCEKLVPIVTGFGPLQNLLENEKVDAVFVNDINSVHIEIDGRVFDSEMKLSQSMLQYVLNITGKHDENIYTSRIDNFIIDVIKPDVCQNGVNISIRKVKDFDICTLIENEMLTKELYEFLSEQILNKKRILISGDINSGKSTLLDVLIKDCLSDRRCYLLENSGLYSDNSEMLVKFDVSKCDYETLLAIVLKSSPEYIISDLNFPDERFLISTMRANSLECAFRLLVAQNGDMSEKYAKLKVLNDYDYIVHLDNHKISAIAELKPAKTMALSVNVIFER